MCCSVRLVFTVFNLLLLSQVSEFEVRQQLHSESIEILYTGLQIVPFTTLYCISLIIWGFL